eukprot:m.19669 g.19669  ORF g.19669 m.19669 type:complete len:81 (+) comp11924_c0_seq1:170-412(+)
MSLTCCALCMVQQCCKIYSDYVFVRRTYFRVPMCLPCIVHTATQLSVASFTRLANRASVSAFSKPLTLAATTDACGACKL